MTLVRGTAVVKFEDANPFLKQHAAWLLQLAVSSSSSAKSLLTNCREEALEQACLSEGLRKDEINMARLTVEGFDDVRAVGLSDTRSCMLALAITIMLRDESALRRSRQNFKSYLGCMSCFSLLLLWL